jgi:hypothetical protein
MYLAVTIGDYHALVSEYETCFQTFLSSSSSSSSSSSLTTGSATLVKRGNTGKRLVEEIDPVFLLCNEVSVLLSPSLQLSFISLSLSLSLSPCE